MKMTEGSLFVNGEDVTNAPAHEMVKKGVCTIPEGRSVFPNLTVTENLLMWTHQGTHRDHVLTRSFDRFPRLAARRSQAAGSLSGGEQQMLAMSRALSTGPAVLLLDEISMGLAPLVVAELYEIVEGLAEEGISILLVEQVAKTALSIADTAAVISIGRIVATGSPEEVAQSALDVYLGTSERAS